MSKMLDLFEKILNWKRMLYVRLDGSTHVEERQMIV
jgi:SNF2 family DNA or RNA helicase